MDPGDGIDRMRKLEEDGAFTGRTVEQLSGEIYELHKKMEETLRRLGSLEARLEGVAEKILELDFEGGEGEDLMHESPPHASGGPRHPSEPTPRGGTGGESGEE